MSVSPQEPFKTWVAKVERQQRIRIPTEILEFATWLIPEGEVTHTHLGTIGASGGLQISPRKGRAGEIRQKLAAKLRESPVTSEEVGEEWFKMARYLGTSWEVTFQLERKQLRINVNLPAEPRKLGLVPSAGEMAIVFGLGEVLEICNASTWIRQNSAVSEKFGDIVSRAETQLEDRNI